MITYKITVRSRGRITQLLDSQKIFGAMMHLLTNHGKAQVATDLVESIHSGKRLFMVSSLMPEGYISTPYYETKSKEDYKALKSKIFLPADNINEKEKILYSNNYIKIQTGQVAQYRISNEFYETPGQDNDLFSVPVIRVINNQTNCEVPDYYFYLTVRQEDDLFKELLSCIKAMRGECFLYGQRASQGYNTYETSDIKPVELPWEEAKCFLNLGIFLPQKCQFEHLNDGSRKKRYYKGINYQESNLKLFTSNRKPYQYNHSKYIENEDFISFIDVGSIICLNENKGGVKDKVKQLCNAGKSVVPPYSNDNEKRIVFGHSFLYPLKEEPKL